MKKLSILASLFLLSAMKVAQAQTASPSPPATNANDYGPYPKNYQAIVMKWLETQLLDAASARIEWQGDPKPAELKDEKGQPLRGYLVNFRVNARNRFGAYTGMQKHGALIRNDEVIQGTGFGYR